MIYQCLVLVEHKWTKQQSGAIGGHSCTSTCCQTWKKKTAQSEAASAVCVLLTKMCVCVYDATCDKNVCAFYSCSTDVTAWQSTFFL